MAPGTFEDAGTLVACMIAGESVSTSTRRGMGVAKTGATAGRQGVCPAKDDWFDHTLCTMKPRSAGFVWLDLPSHRSASSAAKASPHATESGTTFSQAWSVCGNGSVAHSKYSWLATLVSRSSV